MHVCVFVVESAHLTLTLYTPNVVHVSQHPHAEFKVTMRTSSPVMKTLCWMVVLIGRYNAVALGLWDHSQLLGQDLMGLLSTPRKEQSPLLHKVHVATTLIPKLLHEDKTALDHVIVGLSSRECRRTPQRMPCKSRDAGYTG